MLYYNTQQNLWSDNLATVPNQAAALRNKFAAWDRRGFPANGWVALTESEPVYDGSPLTGTKVRTIDAGGTTFSWTVDGVRWDQCVDDLTQARKRCRDTIDAATGGAQALTIEYTIPSGGTLNEVPADGQTVELWMIHPAVETYWVDFKTMYDARGAFDREEFDCTTGRVNIAGADMPAVFSLVATHGSLRRTAWRRLESAFDSCTTAAQYDGLRSQIEGA